MDKILQGEPFAHFIFIVEGFLKVLIASFRRRLSLQYYNPMNIFKFNFLPFGRPYRFPLSSTTIQICTKQLPKTKTKEGFCESLFNLYNYKTWPNCTFCEKN